MAVAGEPVYSPYGQGVIGTWMYGPVPIWLLRPATWMSNIASASLMAGSINILLQLIAIGAACTFWPAATLCPVRRLMAFAFVIAAWPEAGWRFIQADNYAIALGLVSACCLFKGRDKPLLAWCAALAAAMAIASKQTSLGIPLAQLAWMATTHGRRAAWDQALRLIASGAGVALVSLQSFDPAGLWYSMVLLPGQIPFTDQAGKRLLDLLPLLSVHWLLPAVIFWMVRKQPDPEGAWRMAKYLWGFSLPLGTVSLLKAGGTLNSLQGLQLTLPALALGAVVWLAARSWLSLLPAIGTCVVLGLRLWTLPHLPLSPLTSQLSEGVELARANPDSLWFPWNPMISYYADGKFHHVEDGLYVRSLSKQPVPHSQMHKHLPLHFAGIAEPRGLTGWGISETFLPPPVTGQPVGFFWRVRTGAQQTPKNAL